MKSILFLLCLCSPALVWGQARLLVDAIPTAATYAGSAPVTLPFQDAATQNPKDIAQGLNGAVNGILPAATQRGFTFVCLISAPGDEPIAIPLATGKTELKLSRTGTRVMALFFTAGHEARRKIEYSTGSPEAKTSHVSSTFKKVSVPPGSTTADWIYFNLSRIQAEAEKAKSPVVFLSVGGRGAVAAVPIPGMKAPLLVPEEESTFTATWYMDPALAATPPTEVLGHPVSPVGEKAK